LTLEKKHRQSLSRPEPGGFHVSHAGWDITLHADRQDAMSCSLIELAVARSAPIDEGLRAWSARLARRVTGLLEPLRLVEIDEALGTAVLRSEAPVQKDGKALYYELVLERTSQTAATLRRYAGDRVGTQVRESVPFVLTHEAVIKLATDIVGAN
jgi:hypothetical protein